MFAPLIEVWLKSFPLKLILHPTRRVIELEDRVKALGYLSFFVAIIVLSSACSNYYDILFMYGIFLVFSSSYALSMFPVIIWAKKLSN